MRKRALLVVLVLLVAMTGSVYAASLGSIGYVNYADWYSLENEISEAYIPGLRAEFFFSDILGISADALVVGYTEDTLLYGDVYEMLYIISIAARAPLGLLEPYASIGPVYYGLITENDSATSEESFGFIVRGGLDFNIFDWLSFGLEANYYVEDLEDFFNNSDYYFSEDALKERALIGVSAKFKF